MIYPLVLHHGYIYDWRIIIDVYASDAVSKFKPRRREAS